jgi:hypothetical protein
VTALAESFRFIAMSPVMQRIPARVQLNQPAPNSLMPAAAVTAGEVALGIRANQLTLSGKSGRRECRTWGEVYARSDGGTMAVYAIATIGLPSIT